MLAGCGGSSEPEPASGDAEAGRKLYLDNGCAACHGYRGAGDGPLARSLPTKPRDLRISGSYQNGSNVASIAETVKTGLMDKGTGMPPYPHLPERDRLRIAAFLVSLRSQ